MAIKSSPAANWCFTLNNYEDVQEWYDTLKSADGCTWFIFQEEIGAAGTPHLQGLIHFNPKKRFEQIRTLFLDRAHIEPCKSVPASVAYCSKADTRVAGTEPHRYGPVPEPRPRGDAPRLCPERLQVVPATALYPWQKYLVDIAQSPVDDRAVWWVWEPHGGAGKSAIAKYLVVHHGALFVSGRGTDILCAIALVNKTTGEWPELCIIDVPRENANAVSFSTIEKLKNGLAFSSKYESGMLVFPPMHLIIFANAPPDLTKLSIDRWHIIELKGAMGFHVTHPGEAEPPALDLYPVDVLFD